MGLKLVLFFIVGIFLVGFVLGEDSWYEFSGDNSSNESYGNIQNNSELVLEEQGDYSNEEYTPKNNQGFEEDEGESFIYTTNFYIALFLIGLAFLIILLILVLTLIRPKNKWEKRKPNK